MATKKQPPQYSSRAAATARKVVARLHPEPEPATPAPGVYKERDLHTTIVVAVTPAYVTHVPIAAAGLALVKTRVARFVHMYEATTEYTVGKLAGALLASGEPMSTQARSVLKALTLAEQHAPQGAPPLPDVPPAQQPVEQPAPVRTQAAPARRMPKPWALAGKTLKAGAVKLEDKVRPGTFRAALMDAVVAHIGQKAETALGEQALPGKPPVSRMDVEFAVKLGIVRV